MPQEGRIAVTGFVVVFSSAICLLANSVQAIPIHGGFRYEPVTINDTQGSASVHLWPLARPERLIIIILKEKCKLWQQNGVNPLPDYCWGLLTSIMGGPPPSPQLLTIYYEQYANSVESTEREQDLSAALWEIGHNRFNEENTIQ